jgi:hypothetical protein
MLVQDKFFSMKAYTPKEQNEMIHASAGMRQLHYFVCLCGRQDFEEFANFQALQSTII